MKSFGLVYLGSYLGPFKCTGPLLFLLVVNALPDVLEGVTLLLMYVVKMVTRRTQKMNFHSSLTAAWDWSKKWDLPINPTSQLGERFP